MDIENANSLFRFLPTPGQWLSKLIARGGLSKARLAREMGGTDTSQLGAWLRHKDPVPAHQLAAAARILGNPDDMMYASLLQTCIKVADDLIQSCSSLSASIGLGKHVISGCVIRLAEDLAVKAHFGNTGTPGFLATLAAYMSDARFAVRKTLPMGRPIVARGDIAHHLRYPVNRFVGLLLDLDAAVTSKEAVGCDLAGFRDTLLNELRGSAKGQHLNLRRPLDGLVKQHAVHLLARHGEDDDREFVHDLIGSPDVYLKRMAFYGLLIGTKDDGIAQEFRHELEHDENLAEATLAFDAVHYGDASIRKDGALPLAPATLGNTISNLLRTLEEGPSTEKMRTIILFKASFILQRFGSEPFMTAPTLTRLRAILKSHSSTMDSPARRWVKDFQDVVGEGERRGLAIKDANHG